MLSGKLRRFVFFLSVCQSEMHRYYVHVMRLDGINNPFGRLYFIFPSFKSLILLFFYFDKKKIRAFIR